MIPDWNKLLSLSVHETRLEIVEAMAWIGVPVSPNELVWVFNDKRDIAHFGYHVRKLAGAGVIELVDETPVRGAVEHFYLLAEPEDRINLDLTGEQYSAFRELVLSGDKAWAEDVTSPDVLMELARLVE